MLTMATGPVEERNQDATIYVGGLDEKTKEAILWELFLQAGPVVNVHMPKDRITGQHQGCGSPLLRYLVIHFISIVFLGIL